MIHLTRINHTSLILNSDLIENVQATPDTVITLTNGHNYMVLESPEEVISRALGYRRKVFDNIVRCSTQEDTLPDTGATGHGR
jgi:flagellar protein FlbD